MSPTSRPTRAQYRRQVRLADELLRRVARTGDPSQPRRRVPELADAFPDDESLLTHLAARWSRDLAGSLDLVLDLPDDQRERAAATVAARLAARCSGLHAVLRHHADHPAVVRGRTNDRAAAGLQHAPVHAEHVRPQVPGTVAGVLATVLTHCPVAWSVRAQRQTRTTARAA